ncbi:hypothetical protein Asi02nite_13930 [Asanoa siamensis]|uniref:DUF397 domain-containing protein n=1 Tax=Asanoa siamensis TaxID=926357 RepID=A0ABQ4CKP8_9ACTN|nr:hypothetical protein Asi02nite_13930 [Asanoa siamensis]
MPYRTGIPSSLDARDDSSHWAVREEPTAVFVRNARVQLGPELRFTRDDWADLLRTIAAGDLPRYVQELGDGHAIKIAPGGREADALFFWADEMRAFARDVRRGVYGPVRGPDPAAATRAEAQRRPTQ